MMRFAIVFALLMGFATAGMSQQYRIGYVDTEYILKKVPDYEEAQKDLNKMTSEWRKQVERKFDEIDAMYKNYRAEEILLTEDMKQKREEEIIAKEKEAKEFQRKKFGPDGELFQKRQELIKPIQDKIYKAVADVAKAGGYYVIFDKASANGLTILYAKSSINKSDDVLKRMGLNPDKK